MKSFTFKKTFKSFTRAVSPFFKVNSSPSETIFAFKLGSVVNACVDLVGVGGVGVGAGIICWLNTKYPAIPTTTIIPIIIAMFTNPFLFINFIIKKFNFALFRALEQVRCVTTLLPLLINPSCGEFTEPFVFAKK